MQTSRHFNKGTLLVVVLSFALTLVVLSSLPSVNAATATPPATVAGTTTNTELECPICNMDMSTYEGSLTEQEVQGLLLALNDEYHAWAVYEQVMQDFGTIRPFRNIQRAEQNHINAVVRQLTRYGVPVPENPWMGQVASFASVQAACQAGVDAEIANIVLYDQLFASTERSSILTVYTALQQASQSHQQAFERCATGEPGAMGMRNGATNGRGMQKRGGR